ncbi:hypothetical protein HC341_11965 [Aquisalimonas sp. 2447]|uniref:hypothetical protein n=1 Tax=Aquisalimonas sp. 2447 TaxID=2740807 RepID=UPI00143260AE|nr:hypothetical protein [Aquisalimonas sp. 2447]QIT55864.1 hypothetical protein HC341_11965 [Aquisalimonas sp. 2447]
MSPWEPGLSRNTRFHLRLGERRTTVTLDTLLSSYLAIRLGLEPETPQAHQAVRRWLQHRLDEHNDPGRVAVSQWLQREVLTVVVDTKLSAHYANWLLDGTPPPPVALDPS